MVKTTRGQVVQFFMRNMPESKGRKQVTSGVEKLTHSAGEISEIQ